MASRFAWVSGSVGPSAMPAEADATSLRARLIAIAGIQAQIRAFFAARGVVEVRTPTLSRAATTDPALTSLAVDVESLGARHYLRTSPEHAMKRLLVAGSGDIYELASAYRDGELGRWHQPEFTLLEWYRLGFSEFDLMDEVHALLTEILAARLPALARRDLTYGDAFRDAFDIDAHAFDADESRRLVPALRQSGIEVPPDIDGGALLDLALAAAIVPRWPRDTAIYLYDYPADQAALAALKPGPPIVASRFEVFVNGLELANGFRELQDAVEQGRRFNSDLARRRERGLPEVPVDDALLTALAEGLPDCAGVALGVDRLTALALGADALDRVVSFPHRRR